MLKRNCALSAAIILSFHLFSMYVYLADIVANSTPNLHCPTARSNMAEPPQSVPIRRSDRVVIKKRPNDGATDAPAAQPKKPRKAKKDGVNASDGPAPASLPVPLSLPELPASTIPAMNGAAPAPKKSKKAKAKTKEAQAPPTTSSSSVTNGIISIGAPLVVPPLSNTTETPDDAVQPTLAAAKKTSRKKNASEIAQKGMSH